MRVLVTAATRHSSTREIAEAIATGLIERGIEAEVMTVERVTTPSDTTPVVLGSAVYEGRWLDEARRFAQVHTSALCVMPVWLFSSGPLGTPTHPIPSGRGPDVRVLSRLTRASAHRTFAGRLEMKRLDFAERAAARTIHAPEGDSRDWDAIDRFAGEIADDLLRTARAAA